MDSNPATPAKTISVSSLASICAPALAAIIVTVGKNPIVACAQHLNIDHRSAITWLDQTGIALSLLGMILAAINLLRKKGGPILPYIGLFAGLATLILCSLVTH